MRDYFLYNFPVLYSHLRPYVNRLIFVCCGVFVLSSMLLPGFVLPVHCNGSVVSLPEFVRGCLNMHPFKSWDGGIIILSPGLYLPFLSDLGGRAHMFALSGFPCPKAFESSQSLHQVSSLCCCLCPVWIVFHLRFLVDRIIFLLINLVWWDPNTGGWFHYFFELVRYWLASLSWLVYIPYEFKVFHSLPFCLMWFK